MESDIYQQINSRPRKIQKFNEDIIIFNEDDSFAKNIINNESNNDINSNENPIFTLTIELEMGKTEKIDIYKDSDAYDITNNFCIQHNLGASTFQYLKEKIEYLLEEFKNNKNLDIKKCMKDINKDFNEINNKYIIEENKENITNNNKNKFNYFNYFLERNKNKFIQNKSSSLSKTNDTNNVTINKNIKNEKWIKRNKSCKNTIEQKYKKELKIRKEVNKYFDIKEKINNDEYNKKIINYYDNYQKYILNKDKEIKAKGEEEKISQEAYINSNNNKENNFRSLLSKDESPGKNITNDNTNSPIGNSLIKYDIIKTNRNSNNNSRAFLSGINFTKEKPILINDKEIKNYGEFLYEKSKLEKAEKQKTINEIQRMDDLNEYKICPFKPVTNFKKNKNVHSKYLTKTKTELILNQEEKYSFKPSINNNYKTDLNFEERQILFNNLYKKKNEEMKKYFTSTKYDEKGHELFKPKLISRQLKTEKSEKNINIFELNYSYYKKYSLNKKLLTKKIYNDNCHSYKNIHTKKSTDKIINTLYNKVFISLFNDLDSDHDDLITSLTINLNEIPKFILKILEPILKELKDDEQTLNCEEFILVMKKLFKDTPLIDKQKLINYYQIKTKNNINNDKIQKRNKTPSKRSNLNFYYKKTNQNLYNINTSNLSKTHSSNSNINEEQSEINEKKEQKKLKDINEDEQNFEVINNDINDIDSHISNLKEKEMEKERENENENVFDAISKYTFNNFLKQIKH